MSQVPDFDWPCDRREAHGPHVVPKVTTGPYPEEEWDCPGVRAHPATMIGRPAVESFREDKKRCKVCRTEGGHEPWCPVVEVTSA